MNIMLTIENKFTKYISLIDYILIAYYICDQY